jgi:HAD superfamily phosphoserine phosphatase-like hydrolase
MTSTHSKLVLFDLDHTLLPIDSDQTWGEFLYEQKIVDDAYQAKNQVFYQQYTKGELNLDDFLAMSFSILTKHTRSKLEALQNQFIEEKIKPQVKINALQLLKKHQQDCCFLVTATNSFVTQKIADLLGFKENHLIATDPATQSGEAWQYTQSPFNGQIHGLPCFRENKIKRVLQRMEELNIKRENFSSVWAYSDSRNDIPLLEFADVAIATNPDEILSNHAKKMNWSRLYLFGQI